MVDEKIQLDQSFIHQIADIVSVQSKVGKVVLFGSWATKSARKNSDIDLAVFGQSLTSADINLIRSELEENVKTLLKFDVVHFDTLTKESLRKDILSEGIVIYESKAD